MNGVKTIFVFVEKARILWL